MLVKLLVLLVFDLARIHRPKRFGFIDLRVLELRLFLGGILPFFGSFELFFPQVHRDGNVVGILFDGFAKRPGFKELRFGVF